MRPTVLVHAAALLAFVASPVQAQEVPDLMTAAIKRVLEPYPGVMALHLSTRVYPTTAAEVAAPAAEHPLHTMEQVARVISAAVASSSVTQCLLARQRVCLQEGHNAIIMVSTPVVDGDSARVVVAVEYRNPGPSYEKGFGPSGAATHVVRLVSEMGRWRPVEVRIGRVT